MKDNSAKSYASSVHRFTKQQTPQAPDTETGDMGEVFQEARAKSREALMLDVRRHDGAIVSFPYAILRRVVYQPTGEIILRFGSDTVTAEGRNLHRLRDALVEHRARFIQEGTEAEEDGKPEDAAHIERIEIVEGEDEL
ncbi:hypothetical protein [Paludibaculum fermentans]|uniref:hypothetical protein n=1 Tax=Paludibaculum fermentans TaxID=1473598 RepID=UPI003EBC7F34